MIIIVAERITTIVMIMYNNSKGGDANGIAILIITIIIFIVTYIDALNQTT